MHRQNKDSESRRHITKLAWVFCRDCSISCIKEVWMSGLNQHTANVPNRKVPNVRNRLQRAQKPSLLGLCRASGDSQRNPSASALWLVSSVGSEHDATNVGVWSSSLSRVTTLEVWQTSCLGKRHKCRAGVCAGLKIPKTRLDSTRLHLKIRECSSGNEGGLEFLELTKKSAV